MKTLDRKISAPPGATYMSPEQLDYFADMLMEKRESLLRSAHQTIEDLQSFEPTADDSDRATQEEDHGMEIRVSDREQRQIRTIDEAMLRIKDGSYGWCADTGEEIGLLRMTANPTAIFTIEAQQRHERMEKMQRDK